MKDHYQVLIIGGGTAGISIAARLANEANPPAMGLIEPSDKHFYQAVVDTGGGWRIPQRRVHA